MHIVKLYPNFNQEQVCFDDTSTCAGDVICDSSDGNCGEAGCDTGSDYQYYGPPACQRVKKSLNSIDLMDKEAYIQRYIVSLLVYNYNLSSNALTTYITTIFLLSIPKHKQNKLVFLAIQLQLPCLGGSMHWTL